MDLTDDILTFWFSDGPVEDRAVWFKPDPDFDREIKARFADAAGRAAAGELDGMAETARGALALIILLDQMPRNLYRGDARAFAADGKALAVAEAAIAHGLDAQMNWAERMFLYMPYQHAEDLAVQDRSVELFALLGRPSTLEFAQKHRDIVARFGRFPHRNADLGRLSTADEQAFLTEHGRGF
ncbi:MAG: DUF924 family protein [Rhodospirillaceae bacterium]